MAKRPWKVEPGEAFKLAERTALACLVLDALQTALQTAIDAEDANTDVGKARVADALRRLGDYMERHPQATSTSEALH